MAGITRAAAQLSAEEVRRRWKRDRRPQRRQGWLIMDQALVAPRAAWPMARHGGGSTAPVPHLLSSLHPARGRGRGAPRQGRAALGVAPPGASAGRLAPWFEPANVGTSATAAQIQLAGEARVGREVAQTRRSRWLDRHGWRKVGARPPHPKADPQEPATGNHPSQGSSRPRGLPVLPRTSDRSEQWRKRRGALDASGGPGGPGHPGAAGLVPLGRSCARGPPWRPRWLPPQGP